MISLSMSNIRTQTLENKTKIFFNIKKHNEVFVLGFFLSKMYLSQFHLSIYNPCHYTGKIYFFQSLLSNNS